MGRGDKETGNQDCFADDDLVITGIAGRFPSADNMEELKENLLSKKNCVVRAEERWSPDFPGCPHNNVAIMKTLSKFDSEFFNVNASVARYDDPANRILYEVSHEAIVDSGYSRKELSGKNIGVFVGRSDSDPAHISREKRYEYDEMKNAAVGYVTCMVANKISHRFNFTGPSFVVDAADSSSGVALEDAFRRLKNGSIEAAMIAGISVCLDPKNTKVYLDAGLLSPTGASCPYDAKANGFVQGEAVVAIFVQRKKDARRIYAKLHNIECIAADYEPEANFVPLLKSQLHLYRKTYEDVGMDPLAVDCIEGHGSSVPMGDQTEVNSIDEIFCKGRKSPLLLGAVKSNIGNTGATSGLCSIAKVILAFETGVIAPNINYMEPHPKCPGLTNEKIKVITEETPYDKPLAGLNNFGIGGALVHMILERNGKHRTPNDRGTTEKIPKLVVYAATTDKALTCMFNRFHETSMPREFFALLNKTAYTPNLLAPYRGFTILQKDLAPITCIEHSPPVKRQVWYVVTGMGCQWPGMGLDLMELDVFAESMQRSAKILEPFGIDLLELLKPDKDFLQQDRHITPVLVAIIAIQIALVDVLKATCLEPDGIVGHSTGEMVCSYIDGCCTAEQTILSAYYHGLSVESADLPRGAMAAVGLTWEEAKRRCPEGVFPACHNAEDSVTISGSKEAVEDFVRELKSENIFARMVSAHGYAFHCDSITAVDKMLRSSLQKVYTNPKPRSKRWLSTAYLEHEWNDPRCQTADANYFCHNLESPVHFREALTHIPDDAITVEIGPHSLLQSILKRSLGTKASYIGLMKKNDDNILFLLSSVGKLYNLGLNPEVEELYEPVSYPVPRGTPMISPYIQWDHAESLFVPKYTPVIAGRIKLRAKTSTTDSYLLDHCIEGRSLYPATGYIYLAWKALSETLNKPIETLPVHIENFKILRATIITSTDKWFEFCFLNKSGDFEITEGSSIVATGRIFNPKKSMFDDTNHHYEPQKSSVVVSGQEMYNELKIHGYEYGPAFQGLLEVNLEGTEGLVKWNGEWITFLDSLLLFFGVIYENDDFRLPTGALSIKIDPRIHLEFVARMEEKELKGIPVKYEKHVGKCTTPGTEIRRLRLDPAPHRSLEEIVPVLEEYGFVPYCEKSALGKEQITKLDSYMQTCRKLSRQIIERVGEYCGIQSSLLDTKLDRDTEVKEYSPSPEEEDFPILKTLQNVLEMSVSRKTYPKIQEQCQNISDILVEDMLFKSMLEEKPLRSILDVVVENCFGKMMVGEWCDSNTPLLPVVQEIMKSFTQAKASYSVVHPQTTDLDVENLNQKNIQAESLSESEVLPMHLTSFCNLGLTSFIVGSRDSLNSRIRKVASLTKDGGFVLVIHKHELTQPEMLIHALSKLSIEIRPESDIEDVFSEENLLMVSKKSSPFGVNAYLLRKAPPKIQNEQVHIVKVLDAQYDQWIEDLKKAVAVIQDRDNTSTVLLLAEHSPVNGIIGMVNCLMQEPGGDKIRCVFTDRSAPPFDLGNSFYADVSDKNLLMNVYINGRWGSFRHTSIPGKFPQEHVDCAYVECGKHGDLSSFKWQEFPIMNRESQGKNDSMFHVYNSALNFKDVMVATGKLTAGTFRESGLKTRDFTLGLEFSGKDQSGRRIMAMGIGGGICNTFRASAVNVYDVPENWSLEEAATVPVVYSTCYYALIMKGELEHRDKILIHSGSGGIGQAAIRIALSMDCEIFVTVGTPEKRNFLLKTFPQIKPENIGSSRDTAFEEMVMTQTNGEGVDVVLNSLADDKFQASVRCVAEHGRFVEIGKYDLQMNSPLGLQVFLKGISFHSAQMDTYFRRDEESTAIFAKIDVLLYDGIRRGVVQPLNTTVFPVEEVEKAFRYMRTGKHIGKVLLKVREEESEKTVIPPPLKIKAYKRISLHSNKSYIIIGGLGGFGIELAKWLVEKGAGTVILTSRYGARTPYHQLCLKRWRESGAAVLVSTLNVAKQEEAKKLLEETAAMHGPIGGIFNSAVVLKDAFIENQTASDFEEVCAPKALATKHLDDLTRTMCPELDMFVCFSSISCGKGNAGQANYGYANSVMERICEIRKQDGLHGLAVQWGIIGDVGLVHRHMGDDAMIAGVMAQKIKSCLQCLEKLLLQDKPVVSSFVTADKSRMKRKSDDVLAQLAKMFSISDIDQMNPYRTFGEMGIDSMVGVEVKHLLDSSFGISFSLQEIQDMKLGDVKRLVEERNISNDSFRSPSKEIRSISFKDVSVALPTETAVALNSGKDGAPLFIVHGNDLLFQGLGKLCREISRPVFALQGIKGTPVNSLKDMAQWYLKQIQNICPGTAVHLASVSTAASLAVEMALQSTRNCLQLGIKTLTILDGALDLMEAYATDESEKKKNIAIHEASDLCEFLSVFSESDLTQLKTQLEVLPTLESRMKVIRSLLTAPHDSTLLDAAEFYIRKQNLMRFHLPTGKLQKDLTAIETAEKVLPNDVSAVKSFMSQICSGKVTIHRIVGNSEFLIGESSATEVAKFFNRL